ncbi:cupin domain-containing protein [Methylocystis bryophila]|uniref:Cupin n=1 Tax=Methylocystis bryophila TaxID=655015 RepID=A0A1W6MR74_9HYPH|nr:cupin domain-containing protein [Methylocystis bryophila]ARN79989.1 cupin [Methylocystis bryophila]BDV39896.1 cupin [Methylocystis bryophila]
MSGGGEDVLRKAESGFRWSGVDLLAYKEEGSAPFKSISRQTLFGGEGLEGELRYFEIEASGHSTLESHQHRHAVMILRGRGQCLVGDKILALAPHDLVAIAPWTWHQFRANAGETLGFLCLVNRERDKPQLPSEADLARLRADPAIAAFLDGD